jgi:hypothetical protein
MYRAKANGRNRWERVSPPIALPRQRYRRVREPTHEAVLTD